MNIWEEEEDISFIHLFLMVSCNHSINTRSSQQAQDPVVNGSHCAVITSLIETLDIEHSQMNTSPQE